MSRQTDLEQNIRASYDLIRQYEAILQTSSEPKEKARARRELAEQWALINGYLAEYRALTGDALPPDLAQIAARLAVPPGETAPQVDPAAAEAARARYLEALRERYGIIQTHAFTALAQDERVGSARQLPLLGREGVYIPLRFEAPVARWKAPAETVEKLSRQARAGLEEQLERGLSPLTLAEVLQLPGHLAFIGDAGSGKTTLLHLLVTALALEPGRLPLPDNLESALPNPRPLPVLLPLRLFEHACGQNRYQRTAADLLRFVDDWFGGWCSKTALPPGFLAGHIRAGGAWLLLDALDEVPDPNHRQTIRNVIQDLVRDFQQIRFIVTARVSGYKGAELVDRFTVIYVRDLDEDQRAQMIRTIYHGLALPEAVERAGDLINRFQQRPDLADLGRTPVMIWTAAVIHALRGQLPEGRAALYNAYVDILLKHSFKRTQYDTEALAELVEGQNWALGDRRRYLTYAAFQVHRRLEDQPERRRETRLVVGEDELARDILGGYFFREGLAAKKTRARELALDFINLMVAHSGLLYETPEGYTIGDHLTMQEFLAGCYLGEDYPDENHLDEDQPDYAAFLAQKTGQSWWREVFILAVGYLAERPSKAALRLLNDLARQGNDSSPARLAAQALAAQALLQLRQRRQRPAWYDGQARQLAGQIYSRLYAEPVAAPVSLRQEAGLALGLLYGYPGEEGLPDPRFASPLGLPNFIRLEAGWFWMGSAEDEVAQLIKDIGKDYFKRELPRHRVYLDAFELARYPTTNAMFAHFVNAGGYQDKRWWPEAIADKRWTKGMIKDWSGERTEPAFWNDSRFNNPIQPVVGVTWYEAVAYCRWLTAHLNGGCTYRLPTEAEWERAARYSPSPLKGEGSGEGVYPWGDTWQPDHCNSKESGLETTSPVGLFLAGATPTGLYDMAGNVFEWCHDWYAGDYYARSQEARNPTGPEKGDFRVLRGGSWYDEHLFCRCGYRNWLYPNYWFYSWGFRCARTLS